MSQNKPLEHRLAETLRGRLHQLRLKRGPERTDILVRPPPARPERVLAFRGLLVLCLLLLVMAVMWLDRGGLRDQIDGEISPSDVVYFTMVTVTTVGYGDIVPVSARARLIDALLVTPIRLLVWFIFLGTAYEFLIQRSIEDLRMLRLQQKLNNHVVICGYGGAGHHAAAELVRMGRLASEIVVIDNDRAASERASSAGFTALHGTATREEILELAGAAKAAAIVVSVDSDETTALIVLTAREMSKARILVKVIEPENIKLMRRSGADQIISLGALGGSLLADGVQSDLAAEFVTDLVSREGRVHLTQRKPTQTEVGRSPLSIDGVVMVRRGGSDPLCGRALADVVLEPLDEILFIRYTSDSAAAV